MPKNATSRPAHWISVASIVDCFNTLEYKAGRLNEPPHLHSYNTLSTDHPAQRPIREASAPTSKRHMIHRVESHSWPDRRRSKSEHRSTSSLITSDEILDDRRILASLDTGKETRGSSTECSAKHGGSEEQNPFRRRDSAGTPLLFFSSPESRRESVSRGAFERVRAMSTSPHPIVMPSLQQEIQAKVGLVDEHAPRVLSERRSSPNASSIRSDQQHTIKHVEAPFVRSILENIDSLIVEHTASLRYLIDESRRLFQEREVNCFVSDDNSTSLLTHSDLGVSRVSEDLHSMQRRSSSLPGLLVAINQTAECMGLSLSEQELQPLKQPSPRRAVSQPFSNAKSCYPWDKAGQQHRKEHSIPASPVTHLVSDLTNPYTPSSHHCARQQRSPSPSLRDREHSSRTRDQYCSKSPHLQRRIDRDRILDSPLPPCALPTSPAHSLQYVKDHTRSHDAERNYLLECGGRYPPPALVEYDRFAALTDRTSRNSTPKRTVHNRRQRCEDNPQAIEEPSVAQMLLLHPAMEIERYQCQKRKEKSRESMWT